jgi:hypothetical protein
MDDDVMVCDDDDEKRTRDVEQHNNELQNCAVQYSSWNYYFIYVFTVKKNAGQREQ